MKATNIKWDIDYDDNRFLPTEVEIPTRITDEEILKEYGLKHIQDDDFNLGLHIMNAIYNNPYDTEWYIYNYCDGTLDEPKPITDRYDIEDLIDFEDD